MKVRRSSTSSIVRSAIRDTEGRYLILLLRALERQLRGAVETVMANLLVINSSAARENSVSRILVEEAVARLMGITDVIFIHAENTAFGPDSRAAAIETAEARIRRSIPVRGRKHFEGRPTKLLGQFGNSLDKIRKASLGARSVSKDSYERPIKRRLPCAGVQPSNQRQRS